MAEETQQRARLGRGLAALIGDADEDFRPSDQPGSRSVRRVPIELLRRNPRNPRRAFAEAELEELADSIRERGIIQPIIVRPLRDLPDAFEIVAGERRWRAAQRAGLHDAPVVVIDADDRLALEIAIIENVQRSDLNPLEEAAGYDRLVTQHGYTQADLATAVGKSRSHVANSLRLLKLPGRVRDRLAAGDITAGHARALLAVPDPEAVAERIVSKRLTVRDVERLGRAPEVKSASPEPPRKARRQPRNPDIRAYEVALEEALGLPVRVEHRDGAGELRISYSSLEQLEAVSSRLRELAAA